MATKSKTKKTAPEVHSHDITSTVARSGDGNVQITFSIAQTEINKAELQALEEMAKGVTVPGFRKGKAPLEKVKAQVSAEKLLEKTLMMILPHAFAHAITDHKLRPAIYPRFELLSQNDPWQVRATTCEFPEVEVGDYKQVVSKALADMPKEATKEDKEQKAISTLLEAIKVDVPKLIIEEEVNARLSQLLERIEKLGLNLESYLASVNKNPEGLREEYAGQTRQAVALELILNKIAEIEKINVAESEVEQAIQAAGSKDDPGQRQFVSSVLNRRAALDQLIPSL